MAKYTGGYTPEQTSIIEYLINRGKALNKRIESIIIISDGDYVNEEYEKLREDMDEVKGELQEALEAQELVDYHIKEAKKHLDEAERMSKKYGVKAL